MIGAAGPSGNMGLPGMTGFPGITGGDAGWTGEMEVLPAEFRSHGSFDEINVPVILHNAPAAPPVEYFRHNSDLARWMYPV